MPRPIPVDLILHTLVESLLELPEDRLRDLARAISAHCIDPRLIADQWCDGAGVVQHARWLVEHRITITTSAHISAETRAMEVAIARRLADVGLALLVTQDGADQTAASLLLDASRLVVGLERFQAADRNDNTTRTIDALRYEVKAKAANIDELDRVGRGLRPGRVLLLNDLAAENDQWRKWAKTIAGIPSSNNPHDETLRDAIEKRIITAETAPRPAHESLVASLRAELDEARDCARREVVWAPKGVAVRPIFKPGDRVVVARKESSPTCVYGGTWHGSFAIVDTVDEEGDVRVKFAAGQTWWFAAAALDPAPRKPCGGCEGTGQTYGSGGGPACQDCNGTGITPTA